MIINNVPCYNEALIAISKLLQEVIVIKFLPLDDELPVDLSKSIELDQSPNNTKALIERVKQKKQQTATPTTANKNNFTLDKFNSSVNELSFKSDDLMEFFFIYVKYILSHTREKLFNKLRFYELLAHQTDPL